VSTVRDRRTRTEAPTRGHCQTAARRGAGTWLAAGQPVRAETTLSLADDRRHREYVPGDLTSRRERGRVCRRSRPRRAQTDNGCPLDHGAATKERSAATVSTATAGPHAFAMGLRATSSSRLEFVSGSGRVIRSGGTQIGEERRGFSISTRLVIGAWGTLASSPKSPSACARGGAHTNVRGGRFLRARRVERSGDAHARASVHAARGGNRERSARGSSRDWGMDSMLLLAHRRKREVAAWQLELLRAFGAPRDLDDTRLGWIANRRITRPRRRGAVQLPAVFGEPVECRGGVHLARAAGERSFTAIRRAGSCVSSRLPAVTLPARASGIRFRWTTIRHRESSGDRRGHFVQAPTAHDPVSAQFAASSIRANLNGRHSREGDRSIESGCRSRERGASPPGGAMTRTSPRADCRE